jgi:hypothetical protein
MVTDRCRQALLERCPLCGPSRPHG